MNRSTVYLSATWAAVLVLCFTVENPPRLLGQNDQGAAPPIGAGTVTFNASELLPGTSNLDAFVPTGSTSNICMVTLNESNAFFVGPSPAICVQRTFQGQEGVRIIVIPYFANFPPDVTLSVTVYQQGARRYGQPVLYTGP